MTVRPILFSAPMVRALLDGRKTMTRRVIDAAKFARWLDGYSCTGRLVEYDRGRFGLEFTPDGYGLWHETENPGGRSGYYVPVRFAPGDLLWVRETWRAAEDVDGTPAGQLLQGEDLWFVADKSSVRRLGPKPGKTRPGIHMPRWASRLTLSVTAVKVERLQSISRQDAIDEGLTLASNQIEEFWRWPPPLDAGLWLSPVAAYESLWDSINGPGAWEANPWCCAVSFTVHRANVDAVLSQRTAA